MTPNDLLQLKETKERCQAESEKLNNQLVQLQRTVHRYQRNREIKRKQLDKLEDLNYSLARTIKELSKN